MLALCKATDADSLEGLLESDSWIMQPKYDGKRVVVEARGGSVEAKSRSGNEAKINRPIREELRNWPPVVLDGEWEGETLWVFDLLGAMGSDLRSWTWEARRRLLESLPFGAAVRLAPTWKTETEKREQIARLHEIGAEGVVFKLATGTYPEGRTDEWLKFKFYNTASVLTVGQYKQKSSVRVAVIRDGRAVECGKVTIPQGVRIPDTGTILEVRYLYLSVHGRLTQPVLLMERDDIPTGDCSWEQFHHKEENWSWAV